MNLYREAGELLLGSRLKRIGDRFLTEVSRVYRLSNIDFDPAWFPVFFLLDRDAAVTISGFADKLQISQSGATQLIKGLEKKGLLEEFQAKDRDRRTKNVRFTPKGIERLEEVRPVWQALAYSMESLLTEGINSSRFLPALTELEDGFDSCALGDRVLEELQRQQLIKKLILTPWSEQQHKSYLRILLEYLSNSSLRFPAETEKILKSPQKSTEGNLLLLSAEKDVIGFVSMSGLKRNGTEALFFIGSSWQRCGVEKLFIRLLEEHTGEPEDLTLIINQNQSDMFSASRDLSYNLLFWEGDLITLRRTS
jgi:DNA-binding MarR family transcriptional regulator